MMRLIQVLSVAGAFIAAYFISLVIPVYRLAAGRTKEVLLSVLALYATIIASNLFWFVITATSPAWRQPGTIGYSATLAMFLVIEGAPLVIGVYLWRKLRG